LFASPIELGNQWRRKGRRRKRRRRACHLVMAGKGPKGVAVESPNKRGSESRRKNFKKPLKESYV
jgi:hypothetical protein